MKATHSNHPDIHTVGLRDDCERCEDLSNSPFEALDDELLRALAIRLANGEAGRSLAENDAMAHIQYVLDAAKRTLKLLQS